jgi:hypothetical protein
MKGSIAFLGVKGTHFFPYKPGKLAPPQADPAPGVGGENEPDLTRRE